MYYNIDQLSCRKQIDNKIYGVYNIFTTLFPFHYKTSWIVNHLGPQRRDNTLLRCLYMRPRNVSFVC